MPDVFAQNWTQRGKQFQQRLRQEPEAALEEYTRTCQFCERKIIPIIQQSPFPGRTNPMLITPRHCGCDAEAAHLQRIEEQSQKAQIEQEWREALRWAGLIGWLSNATFDSYTARDDWPEAISVKGYVKAYAYALSNGGLDDKPWLMLHGGYGTGKSHLAAAVVRNLLEQSWRQVYFRVWPEYLDRIKASWERAKRGEDGETEEDITRELQIGRLVVIDDIDKQPATEWAKKVLYTALNHRYNAKLPTILTFNYGPDDIDPKTVDGVDPETGKVNGRLALVEYLGEAVLDRLIGDAFDIIEFDAPSYRSGLDWRGLPGHEK